MTLHGIGLDAENDLGRPPLERLAPLAQVVRLLAKDSQRLYVYAAQLRAAGIKVALVWTLATFGEWGPRREIVQRITRYCPADWHIVGNEPDAIYNLNPETGEPFDSPASDAMGVEVFTSWFGEVATGIRSVQSMAQIVLAGMVSGQPSAARLYADAVRYHGHRLDGIDLHLYATSSEELPHKLLLYRQALPDLPFFMFEWSRPAADVAPFMRVLEAWEVVAATFHAWHQTDIAGLHDEHDQPTELFFGYRDGLAARPFAPIPEEVV